MMVFVFWGSVGQVQAQLIPIPAEPVVVPDDHEHDDHADDGEDDHEHDDHAHE